jgi:alkanesulfonate monooxygenase SsuD/methylene tetrahydromethanopterin reductase-like flavin-dependent oxidoreductase (luciferase family)
MKFGAMTLPNAPFEVLAERWRALDRLAKIETVWVADHLTNMTAPGTHWTEAWTLLGALARETTRVRLGPLVSPATLRNPATLARAAATLDDISGGRAELGVGSGGSPLDVELARVERPDFAEWVARLDEVMHDESLLPVRDVPLTIGGTGESQLRLAARYADRWNTYIPGNLPPAEARRASRDLSARLDELCAETGRTVIRSAVITPRFIKETPFRSEDAWEEFVAGWTEAGFDEVILYYPAEFGMPDGAVEPGLFERILA